MTNTPSWLEAPMSFLFYWLFLIGGTLTLSIMIVSCLIYFIYLIFYTDKE